MKRTQAIVLALVSALLILALADALRHWMAPPYTDEQIKASLFDTWQVEAFTTMSLLVWFGASIALAAVLWYRAKDGSTRTLAVLAVLLAFAAGVATTSNHILLTTRTTVLTGQSFGGFYGLP